MTFLRNHAARLAGLFIVVLLYGFARLPEVPPDEREQLAQQFNFKPFVLHEVSDEAKKRHLRPVNPHFERISAWISGVGAAVAFNDLDGDGLANDMCYVDVYTDQVIIAPIPSTQARYPAFTLTADPLPYETASTAPMGCLPGDLNEDGQMDLIVYYWGRTPIVFIKTAPQTYRPLEIATEIERWFTNAATLADIDGDGHVDLVLGNYFQDGARIIDANAQTPDVMQHSMSRAFNGGTTRFFLWSQASTDAVHFREAKDVLADPVNHGWTLGLGAADLDGDLLPELYFANDFGPDRLLHNRSQPGQLQFALLEGERGFAMPASRVLGKDSFKGMTVDFADVNGDGWLDMFISNIAAEYSLEESHFLFVSTGEVERMQAGIAPYIDAGEAQRVSRSSWGWDAKFGDFNNDGVLELIQATGFLKGENDRWPELQELALGNDELLADIRFWPRFHPGDDLNGNAPNPFYVKQGERYVDLAQELGLGASYMTRSIATADVDGDGDLDFAWANQWEPSQFYRNDCPDCGQFLGLYLRRPVQAQEVVTAYAGMPQNPSYPVIGAAVEVILPDQSKQIAQVDGGNGHAGGRSAELHFGLGQLPQETTLQVNIAWRDRQGKVHRDTLSLTPGWHTVELSG